MPSMVGSRVRQPDRQPNTNLDAAHRLSVSKTGPDRPNLSHLNTKPSFDPSQYPQRCSRLANVARATVMHP
jgi:hypothetical protein